MATWIRGELGGEWIHVYVWLSPFAVYLKLPQHFVNWLYPNIKSFLKRNISSLYFGKICLENIQEKTFCGPRLTCYYNNLNINYEKTVSVAFISEKAMATHSSTLAWKIPWRRSLVGCSPWVSKSRTRLSDFPFTFHFHALETETEMATHSSVLAWRIPGIEEPGGLPSMGSHRVGHDWSDFVAAATFISLNQNQIVN